MLVRWVFFEHTKHNWVFWTVWKLPWVYKSFSLLSYSLILKPNRFPQMIVCSRGSMWSVWNNGCMCNCVRFSIRKYSVFHHWSPQMSPSKIFWSHTKIVIHRLGYMLYYTYDSGHSNINCMENIYCAHHMKK